MMLFYQMCAAIGLPFYYIWRSLVLRYGTGDQVLLIEQQILASWWILQNGRPR